MSTSHLLGLGEPEVLGKKALFRPLRDNQPQEVVEDQMESKKTDKVRNSKFLQRSIKPKGKVKRVRTTIDLTINALTIIQKIQLGYRLKTGRVLPLWRAVSQAIEYYGKSKHGTSR
ncbi:MAG TPA: hypothetical protein G4N92_04785 [Anaerolineae bacterium]|nr:hypothetical protein [Anaerolineae bacterium]